jgi:NAD(P)-dependent dehydrogenase (short-subunit alcohol dehydrogenase family)
MLLWAEVVMRTALVTGGARRIGEAIVKRLAAEGWAVAIHCHRSGHEAKALARAIQAAGGRAAIIEGDLADAAAVSSIIAQAGAALGPVALLVNNASVFEPDDIGSLDEVGWERHFGVNLRAPVFLARDFAAQLPDGVDGAIINVIDQRVWKPTPHFLSYTLSKSALFTATQTMAQALARSRVLRPLVLRPRGDGEVIPVAIDRLGRGDDAESAQDLPCRLERAGILRNRHEIGQTRCS